MTKMDLIKTASRAYPDRLVEKCVDAEGNVVTAPDYYADGLAAFIARELGETFESQKETETEAVATHRQLVEAQRVLLKAGQELQDVIDALEEKMNPQPVKKAQTAQGAIAEYLRIRAKEDCLLKRILPKGTLV